MKAVFLLGTLVAILMLGLVGWWAIGLTRQVVPLKIEVESNIPGVSVQQIGFLRMYLLWFKLFSPDLRQFAVEQEKFVPERVQIWLSRPEAPDVLPTPQSSSEPVSVYSQLFGGFLAEKQGDQLVVRVFGRSQEELNRNMIAAAMVLNADFYKNEKLPSLALKLITNKWLLGTIIIKNE